MGKIAGRTFCKICKKELTKSQICRFEESGNFIYKNNKYPVSNFQGKK